jgi:hypothetical protein
MNGAKSKKTEEQAVAARRAGPRRRLGGRFGVLALGVALLGSLAGGIAAAPMASAGTFGQQIDVSTGTANSVEICGLNQNKLYICHGWNTPGYQTPIAGWWWQGYVTIQYYKSSNETNYWTSQTYYVPPVMPGDWINITHQ